MRNGYHFQGRQQARKLPNPQSFGGGSDEIERLGATGTDIGNELKVNS